MALSSVCGGRISDDMLIISFNVLWNGDEYAFTIHKNDQAVMVNECMTVRHDTFGSWIFTFHAIGEDASRISLSNKIQQLECLLGAAVSKAAPNESLYINVVIMNHRTSYDAL